MKQDETSRNVIIGHPRSGRRGLPVLPQAFVHALLIESATRLARPWDTL
jgi:hypothetical protein